MSYIKLDRKMLDWGWYEDIPVKVLWTHILLKANWTVSTFQGMEIPRGAFVTSTSHLAIETGLSEKQVRGALAKLEMTGEVACKKTNKYTYIYVCKWDEYQVVCDDEGTQTAVLEGTREGTPQGNNIRNKEDKKPRNIKENTKEKRPTIDEVRDYCRERNNGVDADRWYAYYESNGFKVGRNPMKDWRACIRTWERQQFGNTTPHREDKIPTYDSSKNKSMSEEEKNELLKLMGRA